MPPIQFATPAPTFEDVWRMFQENAQQSKEDHRLMKERIAETDRQMKERSAETDRMMRETERQMKEHLAETERVMKERSAVLSKQLGDLGNRLGEFVEHAVAPAVVQLFQAQGVEVHEVHLEVSSHRNGEGVEIDLLVINDGALVAVECKSKLTHAHVDEHLERMEKLKRLFPLYKNHRALGAVAAMVMSDSVKAYAQNQGFYVLCQNGENVEVSNTEGFTPRAW
ncbi:MAG: hypothetical protein JZU60_02250 [Ilumatobacteraceae bacterium]|jgi:hypothetical protein|nr:hypothetical protein [Ilumatobacteraceae bacterium]